jgi:hypothetical protein
MFDGPDSCYRPENVTLIVCNVMSLQKFDIFLLKRLSPMMRLLIVNVVGYTIQMGMGNRKRAITFLPRKMATDPSLLIDVIGRSCFDVADQL